ncbi:hypothetical protein M422DRAFT_250231 [Sphaerobolus stellatus SS14]|uniref:Unplaced genomic scaffold SPHSTscaffold_33, whole genome shotgun sequence n=1 Tax=Sphaerobolus stellatus (strain SS14) TaxID=990650 RepID=A0A0C9W4A9_SPHS4|nr:hypothetical protein M422DRAFT_250231 [Sphaerobolus stellatus SS14]
MKKPAYKSKERLLKGLSAPTRAVSEPPSPVKKTAEPEVIDVDAEASSGESDIDPVITISQSKNRRREDCTSIKSFFTMVDKSNLDDVRFCLVCQAIQEVQPMHKVVQYGSTTGNSTLWKHILAHHPKSAAQLLKMESKEDV